MCDWIVFANIEEVPVRIGLSTVQSRSFGDSSQFDRFLFVLRYLHLSDSNYNQFIKFIKIIYTDIL